MEQLKSLFKDPKAEKFYTRDSQLYIFEILAFKNTIGDLFKAKVSNKKSLFSAVDKIFEAIAQTSQKNAFVGILFGGTLSHFLYHLVLGSLHLPYDNMEDLWRKAGELYGKAMEKMVENLRETIIGTQIAL